MKLKIKRISNKVIMPMYKTSGSAGLDLHSYLYSKNISIKPKESIVISSGIKVEIPEGYFGLLAIRSSVGTKKGLVLKNQIGVIDSDYRGEIKIPIYNQSEETQIIENGERLAQLMIIPITQVEVLEVEDLEETVRGEQGFGSTGAI